MKKKERVAWMRRKKFCAFLKNYWGTTLSLAFATASALVGFFLTDDKWTLKALSVSVALIAGNLFLLIGKHLEAIQSTLKSIENGNPKGAQLVRRDPNLINQVIAETKKELFLCGNGLARLYPSQLEITRLSSQAKVRLLTSEIDKKTVRSSYELLYGRQTAVSSLDHLKCFCGNPNIEIHTVPYPLTINVNARDMKTSNGYIRVMFLDRGEAKSDSPCVSLIRSDSEREWYKHYRNHIELLWEKSTPWQP